MKKIFSIFAAAMFAVSSYAAIPEFVDPAETWTVGETAKLDSWKWNSETKKGYASINDDWFTFSVYAISKADPKASSPKQPWTSYTSKGTTGTTWPANGIFQGNTYYDAAGKAATASTSRVYSYKVTNMSAVSLYANSSDSSRYVCLVVLEGEGASAEFVAADSATNKIDTIITLKNFDKEKTYTVLAYGNTASNSNLYEIAFSISGEDPDLTPKAVAPTFSVPGGEYFEAIKVALTSSKADHIFYSMDNIAYEEYTDTIELSKLDTTYTLYAYSTLADAENSDTVNVQYTLTHFTPRPKFESRVTLDLTGITAEDIQLLSGENAKLGTYMMDGVECPSVTYLRNLIAQDQQDSAMSIGIAGREGLTFRYKNTQSDKANILKFPANYVQADGGNVEMWVEGVKGGDTVVFVVTAKGDAPTFSHTYSTACYLTPYQPEDDTDPCYTDGQVFTKNNARIDEDYIGWTDLVYIVEEGHSKIRLKETKKGFRIAKIQIGAYRGEEPDWHEGVENVNASIKAVKRIVNGQIIIEKGDRKFNVLGAEIK